MPKMEHQQQPASRRRHRCHRRQFLVIYSKISQVGGRSHHAPAPNNYIAISLPRGSMTNVLRLFGIAVDNALYLFISF